MVEIATRNTLVPTSLRGPEVVRRSGPKNVVLLQPASEGGNFENIVIPRLGLPTLSAVLRDYQGENTYDRRILFEDRAGKIDPDRDLQGVDLLMLTSLINETPRAYEVVRLAKEAHPNIKIIGGGPQMGMLPYEALGRAPFDVVVQGEGEMIIGSLSDLLLADLKLDQRNAALRKIGGLSFINGDGKLEIVPKSAMNRKVPPDYARLPDFDSIVGLSKDNPMTGGVVEFVRGCVGKCNFCEVIQIFPGYRRVDQDVEIARLLQLVELADQGLIAKTPDGRIPIFITDDLHTPPLNATKFREERKARTLNWRKRLGAEGIDPEKIFHLTSQNRAELGKDPEMMEALLRVGMRMVYLGVESSNVKNLEAVGKQQNPNDLEKDLTALKDKGFTIVAMTIIGLPYDTEEGLAIMAKWLRKYSRYQTANFLTPLPGTVNWPVEPDGSPRVDEKGRQQGMLLLGRDGNLLNGTGLPTLDGEEPPYDLYNGRQFIHKDDIPERGWTMKKSGEVCEVYRRNLKEIDPLYKAATERARRRAAKNGELFPNRGLGI